MKKYDRNNYKYRKEENISNENDDLPLRGY